MSSMWSTQAQKVPNSKHALHLRNKLGSTQVNQPATEAEPANIDASLAYFMPVDSESKALQQHYCKQISGMINRDTRILCELSTENGSNTLQPTHKIG